MIAPPRIDLKSRSVAGVSKDRKSWTTDTLWKPSVITLVVGLGVNRNLQRPKHFLRCALAGLHGRVEIAGPERHSCVFAREEAVTFRLLLDAEVSCHVPDRIVGV